MILVVTNRDDLTADWLILELDRRRAPFVRLNTEDYPAHVRLCWRPCGATLSFGDSNIALDTVGAIWFRRPAPPQLSELEPARREWATREAREALEGVWRTFDGRFVNRPERNLRASVKPEQLTRAATLGFVTPESIVTNDPEQATAFLATNESAICKPLYSGRVPSDEGESIFFTTLLDEDARRAVATLGPEPYFFQEHVPKRYDVRVTVIGDDVFAARIASQTIDLGRVDWRRAPVADLIHEVEELPDAVADLCRALTRDYELEFSAIDLARRDDGAYVFFEVNPNGQWAWIEQLTGLPLRTRLADLLLS